MLSLRRVIGIGGLTFLALNQIIGAGVAGLPGLVAGLLGTEALLGYLLVAILMGLVGLCFAEVGSRVSGQAALYAYACASFGPVVGGIAGTLSWTANNIVPSAAVANLMVDTLAAASPVFAGAMPRVLVICGVYAVFAVINVRGCLHGTGRVRRGRLREAAVAAGSRRRGRPLGPPRQPGVVRRGPAGAEARRGGRPHLLRLHGPRQGPRSTLSSRRGTPPYRAHRHRAGPDLRRGPLHRPARRRPGRARRPSRRLPGAARRPRDRAGRPWAARAVVVGVLFSTLGYLAADMVSSPRSFFALAKQGQLPGVLAAAHPKFGTPAVAIIAYAVATAGIACTGSFQPLVIIASSGTLVLYLITCLGLLRLRARNVAMDGEPFRAPGGWFVPLAASAIIVWMLSTLKWQELAAVVALTAVSGAVYAARADRAQGPLARVGDLARAPAALRRKRLARKGGPMKVRGSAALLVVAVLLVGCGRQHARDPQQQQTLQIDTADAPKSARTAPLKLVARMADMKLPSDGMSFTQARELLLGQGAALAQDLVAAPHPEYNELDCPDATADLCRALFVWKDKRGWGQYIVVETGRGAAPLVKAARWARRRPACPSPRRKRPTSPSSTRHT